MKGSMNNRRLKPEEERRNRQFVVRLTKGERAALEELAAFEGLSASYLVRKGIRLVLEERASRQNGTAGSAGRWMRSCDVDLGHGDDGQTTPRDCNKGQ